MRIQLGHDGPPQNYWRENLLTDQALAECPLRTVLRRRESHRALAAEIGRVEKHIALFNNGVLPEAGGLLDQSVRFIDLLEMVSAIRQAVEAKYHKIQLEQAEQEMSTRTGA